MLFWIIAGVLFIMLFGNFFVVKCFLIKRMNNRIELFQTDLLQKHYEEIQVVYKEMRGWRHDFHNHIQIMKAYRALEENEMLDEYLLNLDSDLTDVDKIIKSGNIMVDAILNSKLSLAESRNIRINAKAVVPIELNIIDIDLCIIIGNLLDNAIEACTKIQDEKSRFIRVYIDVKREHLYISVTNSSGGNIKKLNGRYFSSKIGFHGLGLIRVDRLINKYKGYIKRRDEQGVFTSEIMLPIYGCISRQ